MDSKIREAVLSLLADEGDRLGTQRLLEAVKSIGEDAGLEFADDAMLAVRDKLVSEGVLRRGRGREGSVIRVMGADADAKKIRVLPLVRTTLTASRLDPRQVNMTATSTGTRPYR